MPCNLLSDVEIVAISIVDKAANRKRFYLRKSDETSPEVGELLDLPAPHRLLKGDDWRVVYSVVAEPGWRESPGSGSPGEPNEDEWASPEEIRAAAHRFMKNGGLVNRMHESLEPYGRVVENFIAQADFKVGDELIKEGSWVIGIEPTDEGRVKIENGEFTGVSIQGTGVRTLAKTHAGENPSGPVRSLVAYYMKKKHPFRECVRDNRKRFGPRAEQVCAGLKDIGTGTHKWRNTKGIAKADDIPDDMIWHFEALWKAQGLDDEDATMALEMLEDAERDSLLTRIADKLGISRDDSETEESATLESVSETTITKAQLDEQLAPLNDKFEGIEKSVKDVKDLANRLATLVENLAGAHQRKEDSEDENSRETEVQKAVERLDEIAKNFDALREDVDKLASGDSTQRDEDRKKDIQKDDDASYYEALVG